MKGESRKTQGMGVFGNWALLLAGILLCTLAAPARSQESPAVPATEGGIGASQATDAPQLSLQTDPRAPGRISGKIVDQSGAPIGGTLVKLTHDDQTSSQEVLADDDGHFSFANVPPGPFHLGISSVDLTPQTIDGILHPGETYESPMIMLTVATQVTEVRVGLTPHEHAKLEVKDEEKQRVLGVIPNFLVSYDPNPVPLTPKLKFHLAWKASVDPFTLFSVGALAGIEQAGNQWKEYGQGAQGYAKRYGASYANVFVASYLGSAILPSLLKQDPRYYYKGSGSKKSRLLHALAGSFICKGDNGNTEPNYSSLIGTVAAGGVANLYYPSSRRGAGLVVSTSLIRLGEVTAVNIFEEFISPQVTPHLANRSQGQP